jgi:nucleoside-diphosphate-sugar epimerase
MWLVVGGNGYFGSYFCQEILRKVQDAVMATFCHSPPAIEHERISWVPLDLTNQQSIQKLSEQLRSAGISNLKVVILSASHHPDFVRDNFKSAAELNYAGLTYLLNALPDSAVVWYVSSDVVYGESKNRYSFKEADVVSPLNAYGRQKAVCEQIVLSYGFNVARCSFLIGPSLIKRPHFYDRILSSLREQKDLEMLEDQFRSAIDFANAASLIVRLAESYGSKDLGVVNVGSDTPLSKLDVALGIAKKHGLSSASLRPVKFHESQLFQEKRAKDVLLDNSKVKSLLGISSIECAF